MSETGHGARRRSCPSRPLCLHVRGRRPRRAAPLRGRPARGGARGQPRLGRRAPAGRARRRDPPATGRERTGRTHWSGAALCTAPTPPTSVRGPAIARAPHGTPVTASDPDRRARTAGAAAGSHPRYGSSRSDVARPALPPSLLPLIAAVAVCDAAGDDARIKWPNDIVIRHAGGIPKLAGILTEGRPQEGWGDPGGRPERAVRLKGCPPSCARDGNPRRLSAGEIEPILAVAVGCTAATASHAGRGGDAHRLARARCVARPRDRLGGATARRASCGAGTAREGIDGTGRLMVARPRRRAHSARGRGGSFAGSQETPMRGHGADADSATPSGGGHSAALSSASSTLRCNASSAPVGSAPELTWPPGGPGTFEKASDNAESARACATCVPLTEPALTVS